MKQWLAKETLIRLRAAALALVAALDAALLEGYGWRPHSAHPSVDVRDRLEMRG